MSFNQILNYETTQNKLSDFKGKIVILDFWATWCAPCIESFPMLEELQSKFKQDLQIITITDESKERIERFLRKRDMKLPIVIDEKRECAQMFPHRIIPHTIVIDKSGIVKAITSSSEINERLIQKILSGQEAGLKEKKDVMDFDLSVPLSGNDNLAYQIVISPYKEGYPSFSNSTGGGGPYKGRRILAINLLARTLFEIAYQFPAGTRTILEVSDKSKFEWNARNAICFDLIVPDELGEQRFEIMKQQLSIYFGYKATIEERVRPVKVLQKIKGVQPKLAEAKKDAEPLVQYSGRGLSMRNSPISALAEFLESRFGKPILDETNLSGRYDVELPWHNESPEQIYSELKKLGLELIDAERKIEVLVIKDK